MKYQFVGEQSIKKPAMVRWQKKKLRQHRPRSDSDANDTMQFQLTLAWNVQCIPLVIFFRTRVKQKKIIRKANCAAAPLILRHSFL